jgi:NADH-quinone oxidoreductase subunit L
MWMQLTRCEGEMYDLLWLIPALPFTGFLILVIVGSRFPRNVVAAVGVGSAGASAILAVLMAATFASSPPPEHFFRQVLWTWMALGAFKPEFTLYLDSLSLVLVLNVSIVGFLIHLYSAEFMADDESYRRFFAYMNLFAGSMLTLVLADNLLLLFLGWEGVGLCSFLLIGFWYKEPARARAAVKAFLVTRVGDAAMAFGLFLIFTNLGTLQIQELTARAAAHWPVGSRIAVAAAALLLAGALGKSAQLPLHTWLPDAMAGPTPVSALIHAATMVTAGVYLVARMHEIFALAPSVQFAVAVIGCATLLVAGFSALAQYDIKRVLAYSTISQIGYMFLALGVGAWSAALFHMVTHACFKALLFLACGVIILGLHHEQDMFKMGGLRSQIPFTFYTFLIGAASLAALPLVTAGFYSKDEILWAAWASKMGGSWLWFGGLVGALLTSLYTFRMVFLTFFGDAKSQMSRFPGMAMQIPLGVLAVLSVGIGFMQMPTALAKVRVFSDFLSSALPAMPKGGTSGSTGTILLLISSVTSLIGIYLAYVFFHKKPHYAQSLVSNPLGALLHRFSLAACGFDWLYDRVFVKPFEWIANRNRNDFVDLGFRGIAGVAWIGNIVLSASQTGRIRNYAVGIVVGAIVTIAIMVLS